MSGMSSWLTKLLCLGKYSLFASKPRYTNIKTIIFRNLVLREIYAFFLTNNNMNLVID
ncbi:hypothetical protein Riv7116_6054 [Rivularia sp. PCC 7116]|nr:hypothetical protein Riv7116_6054 [Rivularia sp. PCC 7116]